jgi:hypothetical protein
MHSSYGSFLIAIKPHARDTLCIIALFFLEFCNRITGTNVVSEAKLLYYIRESSLGIATGHGLEGRGSIHSRSKIFLYSAASRPALGTPSLLPNGYRGLFPSI